MFRMRKVTKSIHSWGKSRKLIVRYLDGTEKSIWFLVENGYSLLRTVTQTLAFKT